MRSRISPFVSVPTLISSSSTLPKCENTPRTAARRSSIDFDGSAMAMFAMAIRR